ncbi:MAG: glycosyltransferase [Chitinispirillaceae bacterium]
MGFSILNVAYPFAPVCPDTAGGAEQVLLSLDKYLHRNGHRSLVLACRGSRVNGELREIDVPEGLIDDLTRLSVEKKYRSMIESMVKENGVDLVHFHGIDFERYLPSVSVPVLVTLHLPVSWYSPCIPLINRSQIYFNCVSYNQQSTCRNLPNLLGVIENGVEISSLSGVQTREKYAVTMGRICPEKRLHVAMDAAREAGIAVLLAGKVYPYREHLAYFRELIVPRLDSCWCRFLGALDPAGRHLILSRALCTLVASRAPETSSLVAMESLASGTPVITFPSGALPEIVDHGRTGFIVENKDEMVRAIRKVTSLDRYECRRAAEERFSVRRMCGQYMDMYESIISVCGCKGKEHLAG